MHTCYKNYKGRYFEKSTSHAALFYRCTVENNHHVRGHCYNCDTEYDGSLVIQVCTQYCMGPMGTKYVFSDCKLLRLIGLHVFHSEVLPCSKDFSFDIYFIFGIFGYLPPFKKVYGRPATTKSDQNDIFGKSSPAARKTWGKSNLLNLHKSLIIQSS